jgi:hypothetical protein
VPQPLRVKHYSRRALDRLLAPFGFMRQDHRFNNFYVLPRLLQLKFPNFYIGLSEKLARSNSTFWSFLAVNYVGKYKLQTSQVGRKEISGVAVGAR